MANPVNITTPVGRLVQGSLYKENTTDAEGNALVTKSGPNMGQPRTNVFFAIAIAKAGEDHWARTTWGAQIWAKGHEGMASAGQNPKFAWKITDGDSQVPDSKGRRPCDREGFAGHWILRFSSGFKPSVVRAENGAYVKLPDEAVKLGHYVQVACNVDFNGSQQQPGVFLNHSLVCFSGYGPEIVVGPDAAAAGFGQAPAPVGMSLVPLAGAPLPTAAPGMPGAPPPVPGAPAPAPLIPGLPAPMAPAAMVPVAAPSYTMTAKAQGATREAFAAQGWSDEALIAQGYMAAAAAPVPSVPAPLPPVGSVPMPSPAAPVAVVPNPAILQVPVPVAPAPAPAGPQYVMTAAANGATREAFAAQGWSDAALVQNGYMQQVA